MKRSLWIFLSLLLVVGAWLFWSHSQRVVVKHFTAPLLGSLRSASTAPKTLLSAGATTNSVVTKTNKFAYRLSNTTQSIKQLMSAPHAILLDNALIDTSAKVSLTIPKHLTATGEPGAFIVQAKGPMDAAFRALLASAGAEIVSYIPNDAYLVQLSAGAANGLAANARVQSVLPYEPYYKVQASLLNLAVKQKPLPPETFLTLGLYDSTSAATLQQIEKLGGKIVGELDRSPFGPVVHVQPPQDWLALAQLAGVQRVEPAHRRVLANDLARVTVGVATNTTTLTNYLGLTGKNVIVEVNDTGIDATHPDFTTGGNATTAGGAPSRIIGDSTNSLIDIAGHGTHVAGIIAGNGAKSYTVTNTPQGSVTNADFRGKAPDATLFSVGFLGPNDFSVPDSYLQSTPALTNALISNNSWVNGGSQGEYDLSAASYDAAVRDSLPRRTGPQPVLFVFAAGNDGNGDDSGGNGTPDSVSSPGTAKNVITVGALEQLRGITNWVTALDGTSNQVWLPQTSSSSEVAWYSARGNVGIGTEGDFGRFKPDVVAPGSFVVSTRSAQWDQVAYYSPTNYYDDFALDQVVDTNGLNYYNFPFVVKSNTVNVSVQLYNINPPANLPIYVSLANYPDPTVGSTFDYIKTNSTTIPPDGPGNYLGGILGNFGGFNYGVGDSLTVPVTYDLLAQMVTTNDLGDLYTVLSNLNNTIGPYYRYESGTSMAAPAVSGVLALMQDYFTNTLHTAPSPALLKAMLINGARPTGFYNFQVNNPINYEGWGLINLPNSLPSSLTNTTPSATPSFFFVDQAPTNTLSTGDSRTYKIVLSAGAQALPLRITLAWTDPPGNPAAAIKLVNNLDLIVTNTDSATPTNVVVYYGNDIAANEVFNSQENPTNLIANVDAINNVENIFLPAHSGSNFTIVVFGTAVNVNAVTTQTNNLLGTFAPNIAQDFALVVSSGNGVNTNGFTINSSTAAINPTGDQRVTVITATNAAPLVNQFVGAGSPLLGTNTVGFGAGNSNYMAGALVTAGMTNQWHFYVITNYGTGIDFTNAAFVTYLPPNAAVPREGVFANSDADSTRPEADIDLYVSTDSSLTNLNPVVLSNCVNGAQVGISSPKGVGGVFFGADLNRGGSSFVVDTNSTPGQIYYVGVKSEDQMASQYDFLAEFSNIPFSGLDSQGNEYVTFFPVNIPDGDARHPGHTNTLGLAIYPIQIERVIMTNVIAQQNPGDLVVALNHPTTSRGNGSVVLMNHNSPNAPGTYTFVYNDSKLATVLNSQPSDGPGSLRAFERREGVGVWLLHAADNAPGFVGGMSGNLFLKKHQDLAKKPFITIAIEPLTWFYGFIEVPVGYTNLTVFAVDENPNPPYFQILAEKFGDVPTLTSFDNSVLLTKLCLVPPGLSNSISVGPPLTPGIYYVGVYNPDPGLVHTNLIGAFLGISDSAATTVDFTSSNAVPIIDDAVTSAFLNVTNTDVVQSFNVGIRVDHQRISDCAFTLISPDGGRYLLMENRGAYTTSGAGATVILTNIFNATANGSGKPNTNYFNLGRTQGTLPITYNFYGVADEMTVYYGTNVSVASLILDTGFTNNPGNIPRTIYVNFGPTNAIVSTYLTVIMNQFGNPAGARGTKWDYTAGGVQTNIAYLRFTEDTNLTTTPIKYAVPPFVPDTNSGTVWFDSFEPYPLGNYLAGTSFGGGWNVLTNSVDIATNPPAYDGTNILALRNGAVSNSLTTIPGRRYLLQYAVGTQPFNGLYAANLIGGNIEKYNLPNTNGTTFGPAFTAPDALAFDGGGNLYVADGNNTIWQVTPAGVASVFATVGNTPSALAFDSAGNLYVANYNDNTIQNVSPAGVVTLFAANGGANNFLSNPDGLAFDNSGNLYVANYGDNTITKFTPPNTNGSLFVTQPSGSNPGGVTFDSTGTFLFVANNGVGTVDRFQPPSTVPTPGVMTGLGNPGPLVFDNSGNLYVADVGGATIHELSVSNVQSVFTTNGLSQPYGLAYYSNINPEATNSAGWQVQSVAFKATQAKTPLVLDASSGSFAAGTIVSSNFPAQSVFDAFTLTLLPQDLYYLPEQSLDPITGTSAFGNWEMEILDNRTGANLNASLVSWQLEFIFANTNIAATPFGTLTGGAGATNSLGAAGLGYYTVVVPPTANFATNLLLSSSQPVNVWFTTNFPPTLSAPDIKNLIPNSTNNTASPAVISSGTNPQLVPGTTYYLLVQNRASAPVTFNIQVNFDVVGQGASVHFKSASVSGGKPKLNWSSVRAPYKVQWADQLTSPMTWHTITNPATITTNGVSSFIDNGTQTAPLGTKRFYRLVKP